MKAAGFIIMLLASLTINSQTPTKKQLFEELKRQNVIDPVVAYKISMLETGHLKSKLAIEENNLFGFLNSCGYMSFNTWQECVSYFVKIEKNKWNRYHKEGDYYDFIAWWGYNTGKSYSDKDFKYINYLKKIPCEFN